MSSQSGWMTSIFGNLAGGQKEPEIRMNHEGVATPPIHGECWAIAYVVHMPFLLEGAWFA
tara:strand:+ start:16 stop:195 length:180 start_codon:yes stop_codon:yes gene_type:complete